MGAKLIPQIDAPCFFKDGILLHHDYPNLEEADCVSITFEWQKKDERMDTVTQLASEDELLCPCRVWAKIVRRIREYYGCSNDDDMPVSQFGETAVSNTSLLTKW